MSIVSFLIIFWARRRLILAATISCLVGALIVTAILPPRWDSTVRVVLDYVKPDPVTGEVIAGAATRAYVATQQQLITDYSVASRVAEQVGWFSDPSLIAAYAQRPKSDQRDFRRWLADIVIQNSKAKLVEGSNILEITYTSTTAGGAKAAADALLKAYMDSSLETKHAQAQRNAVWYAAETDRAKQALDDAVAAEAAYERANHLVMQNDKVDAEDARLQTLNLQAAPILPPTTAFTEGSSSSMQLATVEAQINADTKVLGPNNPEIISLQARKAQLEGIVKREREAATTAAARAASGGARSLEQQLEAQKSKVINESEKIGRLSELHQDVELRRAEYDRDSQKAAMYREEANSAETGLTPLGSAATPKQATFPNYLLIIPGAIVLGLGVGVLVSLVMEMLSRRVRSPSDLDLEPDAPLICLIPAADRTPSGRPVERRRWWRMWRPASGQAVGA
jgi:uncharacterized protein involved in exopolysaccharide biosynthesis